MVIAADDVADRRLFVMDQPRAAMAADVVEGPKSHVVVARDEDGGLSISTTMESPGSGTSGSTPT